jgi:hypothetical protein
MIAAHAWANVLAASIAHRRPGPIERVEGSATVDTLRFFYSGGGRQVRFSPGGL